MTCNVGFYGDTTLTCADGGDDTAAGSFNAPTCQGELFRERLFKITINRENPGMFVL